MALSRPTPPRPILVTGAPRSATTWVGRTVAAAPGTSYIHEPFHRWNPRTRRTLRPSRIDRWYLHVHSGNAGRYRRFVSDNLGLSYHLGREVLGIRRWRDPVGILRRSGRYLRHRLRKRRSVMKDPQAIFSAEWLAEEFGAQVVVTVRHPASWVGSIKRFRAPMHPTTLLEQPHLMSSLLAPLATELRELAESWPDDPASTPGFLIANAALQWRVFYTAVAAYRKRYPHWLFVRHEDLARDPLGGYEKVFRHLGLKLTDAVRRHIIAKSRARGRGAESSPFSIERNSRETISSWRHRLLPEEVEQVRALTSELARQFYNDAFWEASLSPDPAAK